jgi:hypothetical protein
MQEWLLSRRIISFEEDVIQFYCQQGRNCECPCLTDQDLQSRNTDQQWIQFCRDVSTPGDKTDIYRNWIHLVMQFTHRDITYPSDRMPAFAGLGLKFQALLKNDVYLAGLWKNDWVTGLL